MLHAIIAAIMMGSGTEPPVQQLSYSAESKDVFSFFHVPSDVVGFKDCPEGFQLTYDGALNNGFGELDFEIGAPLVRVNQRVKTLYRDRLPMPQFECDRGKVRYRFSFWGMPQDGKPANDLVAYVRVWIENRGETAAQANLRASYNARGDKGRHPLPCTEWYRDRFMDLMAFSANGSAFAKNGKAWKNGHLVFCYSGGSVGESSNQPAVEYGFSLKPNETRTIDLKIPYVPVSEKRTDVISGIAKTLSQQTWNDTVRYWSELMEKTVRIELPESKVTDTIYASLAYLLIARDVSEDGKHFIQKVNEFQYDDFYPRDTAYIARTYDMMGLSQTAQETIQEYLIRNDQGEVEGFKRLHPDDWGQSLWAMGSHYRLTGDKVFAKQIYSGVASHIQGYNEAIASDPMKLWPATIAYDNELINGHYTGHNFWAILGLKEIQGIALALGLVDDASVFSHLATSHKMRLLNRLRELTKQTGGYIPPGLDKPEDGFDWENATGGVYPFGVLEPFDPWVTETVRTVREYKWREGISTWGPNGWMLKQSILKGLPTSPGSIHHYQTFNVDEVLLARGEQREVIEDLYSILAHTSSTHTGFEMSMDPWSDRDPQGNYPPHGWFAARYIEYIRNLLVRETDLAVQVCSALSPEWVKPGKTVSIEGAPTNFGVVGFKLTSKKDGADLTIKSQWRRVPQAIRFAAPWFVKLESAMVDGKSMTIAKNGVNMPASTQKATFKWKWIEQPKLSYEEAVRLWLEKNYHPKPNEDRGFLFPRPTRPELVGVQRSFVDSCELKLIDPSGVGQVRYTLDGSEPGAKSALYSTPIQIKDDTRVRAVVIWPDGRMSEPLEKRIRKIDYADIPAVKSVESGLAVEAWLGVFEKIPDFQAISADQRKAARGFDLAAMEPRPDNFALRITGFVSIPKDGVYTFTTGSDDGSRLWIGKQLVVDNDGLHAYREVVGDIALRKGIYPITVGYFNTEGARYLRVFWEGPGFPKQSIPDKAVSP